MQLLILLQRLARQCPVEMRIVFNSLDNQKDRDLLKDLFEVN